MKDHGRVEMLVEGVILDMKTHFEGNVNMTTQDNPNFMHQKNGKSLKIYHTFAWSVFRNQKPYMSGAFFEDLSPRLFGLTFEKLPAAVHEVPTCWLPIKPPLTPPKKTRTLQLVWVPQKAWLRSYVFFTEILFLAGSFQGKKPYQ